MIFPIGDEQVQGGYKPLIAYIFIGINILVFLLQVSLPADQQQGFVITYGVIPQEIVGGQDFFTLLTNMFLHGGWMHLIGNMLFLWVFADNIEAVIGKIPFILFYFGGGLVASAAHIMFNHQSTIPAVGASGAISAVLGAYLVMFPASKIKVWIIYIFRSVYMPALYFLGIWGVQQFINGFLSIVPSSAYTSGVAWWAHIGGFVYGVVIGFLIRRYYESKHPSYRSVPSHRDLV
jgi:membrane associated rhomboid family serine protease